MNKAIIDAKKLLVERLYLQFLEDDTNFVMPERPENLFTCEELMAIEPLRKRLFYSHFSTCCVFVEPTSFDLRLKRSQILFNIMCNQLHLYAPDSEERREVETHLRRR
jgi:hypothetical protein